MPKITAAVRSPEAEAITDNKRAEATAQAVHSFARSADSPPEGMTGYFREEGGAYCSIRAAAVRGMAGRANDPAFVYVGKNRLPVSAVLMMGTMDQAAIDWLNEQPGTMEPKSTATIATIERPEAADPWANSAASVVLDAVAGWLRGSITKQDAMEKLDAALRCYAKAGNDAE
jgi:hypothetical protein